MSLFIVPITALFLMLSVPCGAQQSAPARKGFGSPQLAAEALIKAAAAHDTKSLLELFGPEGEGLVSSGDPVQDRNILEQFNSKAQEKHAVIVDPKKKTTAVLSIGAADWPFPVPLIKQGSQWYFDAAAGQREVLARRIGANELDAIQVCLGFVEAQREYATLARALTGVAQYAQRIISTEGKRDGLYWRNPDGTPGGPISEAVARAIEEGYSPEARSAYHGYYFKVLTRQGAAAPFGEMDYVINGIMIGGFALIAAPAEYGVSGVKTFLVGWNGVVYEKDLGPETLKLAKEIDRFNPDKTWTRTTDEWPREAVR